MKIWYRRLSDVPGIYYQGNPSVNHKQRKGCEAVPEISYHEVDGKRVVMMMWPMKKGAISSSPASRWNAKRRKGETEAMTTLRELHEKLELPGTLNDYHHAIEACHNYLFKYIFHEAWVLEEIERICWLDINLIEKYPEAVVPEFISNITNSKFIPSIFSFRNLIDLYEKEGFLYDAIEVAKIGVKFENCKDKIEQLREKISRIEAENNI